MSLKLNEYNLMEELHCKVSVKTYFPSHIFQYIPQNLYRSWVSSVSIPTDYGLDGMGSVPSRRKRFSVLHNIQTGSGAHHASYPVGTGGSFPRVKVTGV
jgi:hypothetical protein